MFNNLARRYSEQAFSKLTEVYDDLVKNSALESTFEDLDPEQDAEFRRERVARYGRQFTVPSGIYPGCNTTSDAANNFSTIHEFAAKGLEQKHRDITDSLGRLQPDLYKSNEEMVNHIENGESAGHLDVSLKFNQSESILTVEILRAKCLSSKVSQPFIKICLLPDRKNKFQTRVHRIPSPQNPEIKETFSFNVPYHNLKDRILQCSLYDFDKSANHALIGRYLIRNILEQGELLNETTFSGEITPAREDREELGELMLSLCYLPAAGRLNVTIVKAVCLKAMDITGSSDPYVKISLIQHGKRVKKKKTTVKRNTLNPVYNEAMVFDIPPELMPYSAINLQIIDYDRIGHSELIGYVDVGHKCHGLGFTHWKEAIESPRTPVAYWHILIKDS